jgi:hypothetical protein
MKQQSNQAVQPISHNTDTDWQILGELELPLDVNKHSMFATWLLDALIPLNLNADFLNKIRKSAEDVAVRNMQAEIVIQPQRTRLLICIPAYRPLNVQTWGFFRIEKVELAAEHENFANHTIEFYLFPEGR